jgi:hypothetical protein
MTRRAGSLDDSGETCDSSGSASRAHDPGLVAVRRNAKDLPTQVHREHGGQRGRIYGKGGAYHGREEEAR